MDLQNTEYQNFINAIIIYYFIIPPLLNSIYIYPPEIIFECRNAITIKPRQHLKKNIFVFFFFHFFAFKREQRNEKRNQKRKGESILTFFSENKELSADTTTPRILHGKVPVTNESCILTLEK